MNNNLPLKTSLLNLWFEQLEKYGSYGSQCCERPVGSLVGYNLILYIIVVGYASWNLNHFINGEASSPGVGANQATIYFLIFAILAGVVGAASTVPGLYHNCLWRTDTLPAAAASAFIAWGITVLAFGLACKQIHIGGERGWRLRLLEACIIILSATQLFYVLLLHTGMFNSNYWPDYRDPFKEPCREPSRDQPTEPVETLE